MYLSDSTSANTIRGVLSRKNVFQSESRCSCWYALYTVPRHEKAIAERLTVQNIENYLPLYSALRVWHGRKVRVELPLFPSYMFVKMCLSEKRRVLSLSGAIRLVSFNSNAVVLSDDEINRLKLSLQIFRAEPYPFLTAGRCVQIKFGPFAGMKGKILRRKGAMRLVLSLDFIQSAIVVELDAGEIQLAS